MVKRGILIRSYIFFLMLSLAMEVGLFPLKALSIESVPFSLFVVFIGAVFPCYFFREFLRFVRENGLIILPAFLFLLSGLVSVFLSPFPGIYGLKWLAQYGVFLGTSFLVFFLFSLERGLGLFFLKTTVGLALLLSFISFFERTNEGFYRFLVDTFRGGEYQIFDGRVRTGATLQHPNIFGCFLSVEILVYFYLKEQYAVRAGVFYPVAMLLCVAMVLSGSRNAALVLLIPVIVLFFNRETTKAALVVFSLAVFSLVVLTPSTSRFGDLWEIAAGKEEWTSPAVEGGVVAASRKFNTASTRLMLWESALGMFRDRPLFGIGPGGCNRALKDYAPAALLAVEKNKIDREYLHAHNGLLNLLAEFGLAGTLLWLVFLARPAVELVRRYGLFPPTPVHAVLLGLLLSFGPDAFYHSRFYMVLTLTLLILFAFPGEALSLPGPPRTEEPAP